MNYRVGPLREAGLEARWGKTREGAPAIFARWPGGEKHQREQWWMVDQGMWDLMEVHGIEAGFDHATALGCFFSVPA